MQLYITFSHLLLEDSVRKKIPKLKINGKTVKKTLQFRCYRSFGITCIERFQHHFRLFVLRTAGERIARDWVDYSS